MNDPLVTYTLQLFRDSVSQQFSADFGDGSGTDLCGPQEYTLYERLGNNQLAVVDFAYLTFENGSHQATINILTTDYNDAGEHSMVLLVDLIEHDSSLEQ